MQQKPPWEERKRAYFKHLADASDEMLLVSGRDKLSNAQAILSDLHKIGWSVFDRFTAKRDGTIWYYSKFSAIFTKRKTPVAGLLA